MKQGSERAASRPGPPPGSGTGPPAPHLPFLLQWVPHSLGHRAACATPRLAEPAKTHIGSRALSAQGRDPCWVGIELAPRTHQASSGYKSAKKFVSLPKAKSVNLTEQRCSSLNMDTFQMNLTVPIITCTSRLFVIV